MKKYSAWKMLWSRWLMGAIVLGGVLCGMLAAGILDPQTCRELGQDVAEYYPTLSGKELSLNILKTNLAEIFKVYFCGLCLLGIVIIPLYLFLKSFNLGFFVLFMLTQNPWQDWKIVCGAVLAPQLLLFPLLIAASWQMFQMSFSLFYYSRRELMKEILAKSGLMLILTLLTMLISLIIGGLITKLF